MSRNKLRSAIRVVLIAAALCANQMPGAQQSPDLEAMQKKIDSAKRDKAARDAAARVRREQAAADEARANRAREEAREEAAAQERQRAEAAAAAERLERERRAQKEQAEADEERQAAADARRQESRAKSCAKAEKDFDLSTRGDCGGNGMAVLSGMAAGLGDRRGVDQMQACFDRQREAMRTAEVRVKKYCK